MKSQNFGCFFSIFFFILDLKFIAHGIVLQEKKKKKESSFNAHLISFLKLEEVSNLKFYFFKEKNTERKNGEKEGDEEEETFNYKDVSAIIIT